MVVVTPKPSANPGAASTTLYKGNGFTLRYPKNWGILTCNNSDNFELDPTNPADQIGVTCERALKPITVIVGKKAQCQGDMVTLGNVKVIKSKIMDDNGTDYRWCTQTVPDLDITHRVSKTPSRATSKQDYSAAVEQMISTFTPGSGGS